jgi:hypothetical protein
MEGNLLNTKRELSMGITTQRDSHKGEVSITALRQFAKDMFQQWDTRKFGKIRLSELIANFIALGLASDQDTALNVTNTYSLTHSYSSSSTSSKTMTPSKRPPSTT